MPPLSLTLGASRGPTGRAGWSPVLAVVTDGDRRVLQVADWVGGEGTKPAAGLYLSASGFVPSVGDGIDIGGAISSVSSVFGEDGAVTAVPHVIIRREGDNALFKLRVLTAPNGDGELKCTPL